MLAEYYKDMYIRDVMTKDIISVTPEMSYAGVVKVLHDNKVGSVAVCEKNGKLVGMVSEKDLFRALFPHYGDYYETPESFSEGEKLEHAVDELRDRPISLYMNNKVVSIRSDEPIMKAGGLMLARHVHQLPVVDGDKLVGMISREEVFGSILKSHIGF